MTKLARWRGREIGIIINAGPVAIAHKREVVDNASFWFEDNGQRRHPKPQNFGRETRIKNQGTPVYNVGAHLVVNNGIMRGDAGMITIRKLRRQIPPPCDAHRRAR